MPLSELLKGRLKAAPTPQRGGLARRLGLAGQKGPVGTTAAERRQTEIERILALPSRPPLDLDSPEAAKLAAEMTIRLRKPVVPPCQCQDLGISCPRTLLPVQGWALKEASDLSGVLGAVGVGHGKTLLGCLTPMVVPGCKVAVMLVPPSLLSQLDKLWSLYSSHGWRLPNLAGSSWFDASKPMLHVVAYSSLSIGRNTELLELLKPDLIIADEAQRLKDRSTATTVRVLRYFEARPQTRMCAWSGTLTKKALEDFAHLAMMTLRDGSPLPTVQAQVEDWGFWLNERPNGPRSVPFAHPLISLLPAERAAQVRAFGVQVPVREVRQAWRRRFQETPGVIFTAGKSINIPTHFLERGPVGIPTKVKAAYKELKSDWIRPDGEWLETGLDAARCARELACGFYYRWTFPRGESEEIIKRWFKARKAYVAELRSILVYGKPYLDSPLLCFNAAQRHHEGYQGKLPTWSSRTWAEWAEVKDLVKPVSKPVWLDDFLAKDAVDWGRQAPGVIWYAHVTFGERVAELGGFPFYGAGEKASEAILEERGDRTIVASIASHHEGKNLQAFNRQLVANPPSDGGRWEQLLGRMDRTGQRADHIEVYCYRHVEEMVRAVDKAASLAQYIEDMLGTTQRLLQKK